MTTIYITGPMTGYEDWNRAAFTQAREWLRSLGHEVLCPSEKTFTGELPIDVASRHLHLRADIEDVLKVDYLYAIPGWEKSQGALLETAIALELKIPVMIATEFASWDQMPLLTMGWHPWYSTVMHPSIDRFAVEYQNWVDRNFANTGNGTQSMVGVGEEVGELAEQLLAAMSFIDLVKAIGRLDHAHLKGEQGIRHTPEEIRELKIDAVGDIQVYLQGYTLREGLPNIGECLAQAWREVRERDWKKNTVDGSAVITKTDHANQGKTVVVEEKVIAPCVNCGAGVTKDFAIDSRARIFCDANCRDQKLAAEA